MFPHEDACKAHLAANRWPDGVVCPVKEQQKTLNWKLWGHYGYYGITGNGRALQNFSLAVRRIWRRWLTRRSRLRMSWERFNALAKAFPLAPPVVVHSALRLSQ